MTIKEKIAGILGDESTPDMEAKIDAIISGLGTYMVSKDQYNKKVNELGSLQETVKNLENEKLSVEEKQRKELEEIINNAKKNEAEFKLKSNRLEAIEIFKKAGLNENDYKDFVDETSKSYIVSDDLERTTTLAQSFVNTLNSQKKLVEDKLKKELQGNNPTPPAGDGKSNVVTKEQLNKMTYSEEMAFAQNNPEQYAELIK